MHKQLQITAASVRMYQAADANSEPSNELLYGETVECLESLDSGWLHVQASHDGYEGYIAAHATSPEVITTTHFVSVPITHIYEQPDYKATPRHALYFGAQVTIGDNEENGFVALSQGGWIFKDHVSDHATKLEDYVETALKFLEAPYLWGGRTAMGLDCSALVQLSLNAAGYQCPRDTGQQIELIGQETQDTPARGDLVFFERHVGIMLNDTNILNATSRHMTTLIEPLEKLEKIYGGIQSVRRV